MPQKSILKTIKLKYLSLLILVVSLSFVLVQSQTKAQTGNVNVSASVHLYPTIKIDPEKRIPPVGNDSLEMTVEIRPVGSLVPVYTDTGITDSNGEVLLTAINPDIIPMGNYDIAIKGISHLTRLYSNIPLSTYIDLSSEVLYAGDSHPTQDNYVNSLDISYEVINIYSNDLVADLNRDTTVNSLDFSIQIPHLYQTGDQ